MPNSTCISFPQNPGRCDTLVGLRRAVGSVSLIGCLFMIFIIWLFKHYVAFTQRFILYLSIAGCFNNIAFLMAAKEDGHLCEFHGWFTTFFDWQVLLLVTCMTFNLFMNVIKLVSTEKYEWFYIVICLAVPLLISLLPFIGDAYGPSGAWCWIVPDTSWRIGIWYGPLFVILLGLTITYSYIIYSLHKKKSKGLGINNPDTNREEHHLKNDMLRIYPLVYLGCMVFPLINRIQNAISPKDHVFGLMVIASITSPLHGLLNALVFGMNRDTLQKLRPSEIKLAFESKFGPQSVLREYLNSQHVELPQLDSAVNPIY